jgi:membrane protein implicated in regulation of membrane protease activity
MEHAVRNLLHLPLEIATALLFAASIGIGAGVVATSYTHRLGDGLKMALVAFLLAAGGFGYVIWRHYRPQRKSTVRHLQTAGMAVPR